MAKISPARFGSRLLTCPYCYERIELRGIMFLCNGRVSRTGNQCRLRPDPILEARTGVQREGGPVFAADGRKKTAQCPECASETRYRLCPVCHSHLPTEFGLVDDLLIAMVGSKGSGKTVYMTVLVHEMMHRMGAQLDAAIMAADDDTRLRFAARYEDLLYVDRQMPVSTPSANVAGNRVAPLVFRFSMTGRRLLGTAPTHTLLSFFDAAGEDLISQESMDLNGRYLGNADGIILLLDPLQLSGARRDAAPGTVLPDTAIVSDNPENVLLRITDLLRSAPGISSRKAIDTPLAVVFPKMDALTHTLGPGSPLLAAPPGGDRFDVTDSMDVHVETMRLLKQWSAEQIDQIVAKNYSRHRYFGVSALGANPTEDLRAPMDGIRPYRVTDPFLWLLSELGAIEKAKDTGGRRA
jgi:Double-GTPase 2